MSQIVKCVKCDNPLVRINTKTLQVYNIDVNTKDDKPFRRMDEKDSPTKRIDTQPPPPIFSLRDRKIVKQKKDNGKGIVEETETEEPMAITCICGHINKIC